MRIRNHDRDGKPASRSSYRSVNKRDCGIKVHERTRAREHRIQVLGPIVAIGRRAVGQWVVVPPRSGPKLEQESAGAEPASGFTTGVDDGNKVYKIANRVRWTRPSTLVDKDPAVGTYLGDRTGAMEGNQPEKRYSPRNSPNSGAQIRQQKWCPAVR